jgi:crotonobetainyl-CoA:carnitine CoA-transferase CaiB-like acyl-CoA transferase
MRSIYTTEPMDDLPAQGLPRPAGRALGFLAGLRVLDLTTSVAGPYAAMLLGDLGADVAKMERPGGGDDARSWGPPYLDGESLWFLAVNRNKRSVVLDPASEEGAAVLRALAARADVFLTNQVPRVARKLGLDPESVRALRPDIVYVSITGFGLTGSRADWTCYDLIAEGYSGIMDVTGAAGGDPQKVGAPAADMLAGQDAAMAAVAALFGRARTGEGCVLDISLVDSMTRFLSCRIVPYLGSGEVPTRSGGTDSVIAVYQAFDTADLPMTLGLGNDALWRRFWTALGRPERGEDPALGSNPARRARRSAIVAEIQAALRERPRAEWLALLRDARVPAGPINRVDEVAADPALAARGLFYAMEAGDGRLVPQVGTGLQVDGQAVAPRLPPPRLGAHTAEVLADWLGTAAADVRGSAEKRNTEGGRP